MLTVEVSKSGTEIGTITFRGITASPAGKATLPAKDVKKRLYRCQPANLLSKAIVRRIADNLSFGIRGGQEDGYEWHT